MILLLILCCAYSAGFLWFLGVPLWVGALCGVALWWLIGGTQA